LTDVWTYLALNRSPFYTLWGGVAVLLAAVGWYFMPDEDTQLVGTRSPFVETVSFVGQLRSFLVFIPFAAVGTGF
jgi:hypothetical protein